MSENSFFISQRKQYINNNNESYYEMPYPRKRTRNRNRFRNYKIRQIHSQIPNNNYFYTSDTQTNQAEKLLNDIWNDPDEIKLTKSTKVNFLQIRENFFLIKTDENVKPINSSIIYNSKIFGTKFKHKTKNLIDKCCKYFENEYFQNEENKLIRILKNYSFELIKDMNIHDDHLKRLHDVQEDYINEIKHDGYRHRKSVCPDFISIKSSSNISNRHKVVIHIEDSEQKKQSLIDFINSRYYTIDFKCSFCQKIGKYHYQDLITGHTSQECIKKFDIICGICLDEHFTFDCLNNKIKYPSKKRKSFHNPFRSKNHKQNNFTVFTPNYIFIDDNIRHTYQFCCRCRSNCNMTCDKGILNDDYKKNVFDDKD